MKNAQPKLDSTLFLDRTHGKTMAAILRRVGVKVKTIYQVYPRKKHETVKDPQWIEKCGQKGWIAVSGDKRIEKNVENKQAVIDAKCRVFLLTDSNSLPEEWASAIILGREKMNSVIRKNNGPFFATISKRSDSHVSHARFPNQDSNAVEEVAVEVMPIPKAVATGPDVEVQSEEPGLFKDEPEKDD